MQPGVLGGVFIDGGRRFLRKKCDASRNSARPADERLLMLRHDEVNMDLLSYQKIIGADERTALASYTVYTYEYMSMLSLRSFFTMKHA